MMTNIGLRHLETKCWTPFMLIKFLWLYSMKFIQPLKNKNKNKNKKVEEQKRKGKTMQ